MDYIPCNELWQEEWDIGTTLATKPSFITFDFPEAW